MNAQLKQAPVGQAFDAAVVKLDYPKVASLQVGAMGARGELRGWLCFRTKADESEGVLFVSRDHRLQHAVLQYEARLALTKIPYNVIEVTTQEIVALNRGSDGADNKSNEDEQTLVLQILREAGKQHASDVHIQVREQTTIIRFRVHGRLRNFWNRTRTEGDAWVTALYNSMCAEQEQVLNWKKDQKANLRPSFAQQAGLVGGRVATRPAKGNGLLVVIRLQYPEKASATIESIGFLPDKHMPLLKYLLARTHGIILVSGATGNGKSMTLKTFAERYCAKLKQACHFLTIEDPTEYEIAGDAVVQTPLIYNTEEVGSDTKAWALAIKSAVRLDPDAIMPGELRDVYSAIGAAEAALTGHLVLSTLHVYDCTAILERLRVLGVTEDLLFNPSLFIGLINQSLAPALCPDCSVPLSDVVNERGEVTHPEAIDPDVYERLCRVMDDRGSVKVRGFAGHACSTCGGTGEASRRLLAEICVPDAEFMETYASKGMLAARKNWVSRGGFTKTQHALRLIGEGALDPSSVEGIIGPLDLEKLTLGA